MYPIYTYTYTHTSASLSSPLDMRGECVVAVCVRALTAQHTHTLRHLCTVTFIIIIVVLCYYAIIDHCCRSQVEACDASDKTAGTCVFVCGVRVGE